MSQYIEFFVKSKEDNFTCIDAYSRSNLIYRLLSDDMNVPYGKVKKITSAFLKEALNILEGYRKNTIERQENEKENINRIASFNNSAQEKIDLIYEIQEILDEYQASLDEMDAAMWFLRIMLSIVDNLEYEKDAGLYCGVEVGRPTLEDIVGE